MAKLKLHFIVALAAVFSMSGVLTLLTSPALAGPPMSNDACLNKALRIRDRAQEDVVIDSDPSLTVRGGDVACTNFCLDPDGDMTETIASELFKRQPGQGQAQPLIIASIVPFPKSQIPPIPPRDLAYADSFPHGQVAYFCDVTLETPNDITSVMTGFDRAFVAVGSASTGADPCSILQKLCEANP